MEGYFPHLVQRKLVFGLLQQMIIALVELFHDVHCFLAQPLRVLARCAEEHLRLGISQYQRHQLVIQLLQALVRDGQTDTELARFRQHGIERFCNPSDTTACLLTSQGLALTS